MDGNDYRTRCGGCRRGFPTWRQGRAHLAQACQGAGLYQYCDWAAEPEPLIEPLTALGWPLGRRRRKPLAQDHGRAPVAEGEFLARLNAWREYRAAALERAERPPDAPNDILDFLNGGGELPDCQGALF